MMQPRSASTHSKINCMMRSSNWSMSSVWLTASAVRYMTCRLLRARASQRLCGPVGRADRRSGSLPAGSSSGRSASDRPGCRPRTMSILSARLDDGASPGPVKSIMRAADLHLVAAGQLVLLDPLAVDERAVGAAQVGEDVVVAGAADLGVPARDFGVVHLDLIARLAPQGERGGIGIQLEPSSLIPALNDEQRGHGLEILNERVTQDRWNSAFGRRSHWPTSLRFAGQCHPAVGVPPLGGLRAQGPRYYGALPPNGGTPTSSRRSVRSTLARAEQLLDFTDERLVMIGFGDKLATRGGGSQPRRA